MCSMISILKKSLKLGHYTLPKDISRIYCMYNLFLHDQT